MIETFIAAVLTALAYCTLAVGTLWLLERLRILRDGAVAELLWRGALWLGIVMAAAICLRAPVSDLMRAWRPLTAANIAPAAVVSAATSTQPRPPNPPRDDDPELTSNPAQTSAHVLAPAAAQLQRAPALWLAAAFALMLMLAVVALLRALWSRRCLLAQARRHARPGDPAWTRHCAALAPNIAALSIRSVTGLASPIAVNSRLILLPDWCDALHADAQRALLAHELAHIERGDPQWRLRDAVAVALLAGFPLARYAERRLHDLSELACDAESARRTGAPRALAECLALCLEHSLMHPPALAVAMATPARGIVARVHCLLEEQPMFWSQWSPMTRHLAVVGLFAAALILPGIAISIADERGSGKSISIHSSDAPGTESLRMKYRGDGRKLSVDIEGKVTFNDDESAVTSISSGGELRIIDVHGGRKRDLRLQPTASGFDRSYRVDGDDAPFDAEAAQWFAGVMPEIFRLTGIDAKARLARIIARGGVDAAFAEIALIGNEHARGSYIGHLFRQVDLDEAQLDRVLVLIADINSDYELRRALTPALTEGRLSALAQTRVLAMVEQMQSDYEVAELLIAARDRVPLQGEHLQAWQKVVSSIGSDYEHRRVLMALLGQKDVQPEQVIAMAAGIDSSYEQLELLKASIAKSPLTVPVRSAYLGIAGGMSSDYERGEALQALIEKGDVDAASALDIMVVAQQIGSDHTTKEVLLALAKVMPATPDVINAYRGVARGLSTYERGEVEAGLDRFVGS